MSKKLDTYFTTREAIINGALNDKNNTYFNTVKALANNTIGKSRNSLIRKAKHLFYLGGATNEARRMFWKKFPKTAAATDSIAKAYGINPALLRDRLNHEGFTDEVIRTNNMTYSFPNVENAFTDDKLLQEELSGYNYFGLDDVGTLIKEGKVKLINEQWKDGESTNERGRNVHPAYGITNLDNIGITAATLKYLRDEAKKKNPTFNNPALDRAASIYYNRGISGGQNYINNGGTGYVIQYKYGGCIPVRRRLSNGGMFGY